MKRLLRRLSRISDSTSSPPLLPRSKPSRVRRCRSYYIPHPDTAPVPAGHLPLCVEDPSGGSAPLRFVVPAALLTAPAIARLLSRSAQEYGYEQSGVLRIPCPADVFQRALDSALSSGAGDGEETGWRFWDEDAEVEEEGQRLGWPSVANAECGWCC